MDEYKKAQKILMEEYYEKRGLLLDRIKRREKWGEVKEGKNGKERVMKDLIINNRDNEARNNRVIPIFDKKENCKRLCNMSTQTIT